MLTSSHSGDEPDVPGCDARVLHNGARCRHRQHDHNGDRCVQHTHTYTHSHSHTHAHAVCCSLTSHTNAQTTHYRREALYSTRSVTSHNRTHWKNYRLYLRFPRHALLQVRAHRVQSIAVRSRDGRNALPELFVQLHEQLPLRYVVLCRSERKGIGRLCAGFF